MELYQDKIVGTRKGLDRIRFRGTMRLLANQSGMRKPVSFTNILLKDSYAGPEGLTAMMQQSCPAKADGRGIETHYLRRADVDKEKFAREIAKARGIREGSICMFNAVKPFMAPMVRVNRNRKSLELVTDADETDVNELSGLGGRRQAPQTRVLLVGE